MREKYKYFAGLNSPGVAALSEDSLRIDIEAMRPLVDVLIVSVHWGDDYKPVRQLQRNFGRLAIDLGADAVIGHHPHVPQPVELYKGRPIIYSIGNFVFSSMGKEEYEPHLGERRKLCCGMPVILHIDYMSRRVKMIEFIPVLTQNHVIKFVSRRADFNEAHNALELLRMDSKLNNADFEIINASDGPRGVLWLSKYFE